MFNPMILKVYQIFYSGKRYQVLLLNVMLL